MDSVLWNNVLEWAKNLISSIVERNTQRCLSTDWLMVVNESVVSEAVDIERALSMFFVYLYNSSKRFGRF